MILGELQGSSMCEKLSGDGAYDLPQYVPVSSVLRARDQDYVACGSFKG